MSSMHNACYDNDEGFDAALHNGFCCMKAELFMIRFTNIDCKALL